jgi:hypothetical protein
LNQQEWEALNMVDIPMKVINSRGEEEITTLRKLWPRFRKGLRL